MRIFDTVPLWFVSSLIVCGTMQAQTMAPSAPLHLPTSQTSDTQQAIHSVQQTQANPPHSASGALPSPELRISGGDLMEFSVFGAPELTQQFRVDSNGNGYLALLGKVHLADLTVADAQALLEKLLLEDGYVKKPYVNLLFKEFSTQGISILGEVQKPGIYSLPGERRLFDVISIAGGTTIKSGNTVTITHRDQPDKPLTVSLSHRPGSDPSEASAANIEVFPGDTIVVSKAGMIYVVGDVNRPGGFVMEENERYTVLKSIAMAAGTLRTAKGSDAKILRDTPTGVQTIPVPLNRIATAKSPDLPLQAGDIVFIPSSTAKRVGMQTWNSIVQVATSLAIYRP
jgi:polysaccharide biosynthesis/export protein